MDYFVRGIKYVLDNCPRESVVDKQSQRVTAEIGDIVESARAIGARRKKLTNEILCKIWGDFPEPGKFCEF